MIWTVFRLGNGQLCLNQRAGNGEIWQDVANVGLVDEDTARRIAAMILKAADGDLSGTVELHDRSTDGR